MKKIIASLQWTIFIIAGNLIPPIAVAASFGLNPQDTMLFLQRTIFVLGVAGLIQGLFGHKLPIYEGPAGLWWGVFTLYASLAQALFGGANPTLQVLSFSLMLSGIICIVLSLLGIVDKLSKYFTPKVVGVYLILLAIQLASGFLKGMMGVGYLGNDVSPKILLISIILVLISISISKSKNLSSYAVMIVIIVGWGLFYLLGLTKAMPEVNGFFQLPGIFVFGFPKVEFSMIPTVLLITLLLLTNMLASIQVVKNVVEGIEGKEKKVNIKKSGIITGINQIISGGFSAIGPVPLSAVAGFLSQTKMTSMMPFIVGNILVIVISTITPVTAFFSTLPTPVGYSAIFIVFAKMVGLGIGEFDKVLERGKLHSTIGIPLFIGAGIMFVPTTAFMSLSPALTSFLSNGLVLGTIVALIMETVSQCKSKNLKKEVE
ncbi:purine/pyrimidine permease [Clostridium fallax]|uniref:Xanthine/uracil permease n=1 Tax=Clostridium fallax TaxID=1533 RepID=A0A1M4Y1B9_9CLOT|nr:purine/pyrimidine permease [Clostridium fallax]SHE99505.1 Xanthine/uracil permease [Clostridium fallax]SQB07769.1 xanthine permease [Clostridium fallax]